MVVRPRSPDQGPDTPAASIGQTGGVRTIVLGTDGSLGARAATAWVATNAPLLGAEVAVVHSIDLTLALPPPTLPAAPFVIDDTVRAAVREQLHDWCAPLRDAGLVVHEELYEGNPVEAITTVARARGADLVVVGRRGHGGFAELVLGSVAHALTHHADVAVVVVPA